MLRAAILAIVLAAHCRPFILFGVVCGEDVTKWNLVATNAASAAGQSPPLQTRTYAIVHIAIHDALNAIDRRNGLTCAAQ